MFSASEERIPVNKHCPVLVPGDGGKGEPGWKVVAIGETGVDVCQIRTGQLRGLSWDDLYWFNPTFDIDAVLAEDAPAPTAAAPAAAPSQPAAPQQAAAVPAAAPTPAPAPATPPAPPAPAFKLAVGRALAVPDGQGGMAPGRWEVAEVGDGGVVAVTADGETYSRLTWGQVLRANPDFLPPTSRVILADGRKGMLISYNGDLVTIEGAASYQDASLGLRSHAFVGHELTESLDVFAARNASVIG